MTALGFDPKVIGVNLPVNEEGSETDMCKAFEDIKAEEREEGRIRETYDRGRVSDSGCVATI